MKVANSNISSSMIKLTPSPSSDIIFAKIHCKGHKDIIIDACYRRRKGNKPTIPELAVCLASVTKRKTVNRVLIDGYFNVPG